MKLTLTEKNNHIHDMGELAPRKRDGKVLSITTNDVLKWIEENFSHNIGQTVSIPSTKHLHNSTNEKALKGEWVFLLSGAEVDLPAATKTLENKKEINDTTINIVKNTQTKATTSKRKKRSRSK